MLGRGLLLDRDGVINEDRGYVGARADFVFREGACAFLRWAVEHGWRLAVVTNQSGVARGFYPEESCADVTAFMVERLREHGVTIDAILACFEHPDAAIPAYRRGSYWRKPNPGMVREALARLRVDPARSALIGDQMRDIDAAQDGGVGLGILLADDPRDDLPRGACLARSFDDARRLLESYAMNGGPGRT